MKTILSRSWHRRWRAMPSEGILGTPGSADSPMDSRKETGKRRPADRSSFDSRKTPEQKDNESRACTLLAHQKSGWKWHGGPGFDFVWISCT